VSDVYAFRAVRSPRRAEPDRTAVLRATWDETVPGTAGTRGGSNPVTLHWGDGPLLTQLRGLAASRDAAGRAGQARSMAEAHLGQAEALDGDTPDGDVEPTAGLATGGALPGQAAIALIRRLDRWLVREQNRPSGEALDAWLAAALRGRVGTDLKSGTDDAVLAWALHDRARFFEFVGPAWARLVDALAAALLVPDRGEQAQRLTRLLLVAGLLEARSRMAKRLKPDETFALLARRIPLLPDPPFPAVLPEPRVKLVRQASVSDLFVVRREWRCYVAGEIADVRNVLAGERSELQTTRIDEREVTEVVTSETVSISETSFEASESSSFSEQTRREMDLALHAEGQVDTSGQ
jgi:hypothetical protein